MGHMGSNKDVVGLDTNCDQQVGFPNLELTGPVRMEVGESSLLADLSPPMLEAHLSMMAVMSIALHEASLSQNEELGQHGELPRVVDVIADGGFHAEKSPALVIQVRNQSSAMESFGDPVIGKESVSWCSSDVVNLDSGKAILSGCTSFDVEVIHGLGNRDFGFTGDMVVSLAMAAIEPPILKEVLLILCRHPWVVQNRFSPLSNLGNGVEAEFGEGEAHEEERSSPHDDMSQQRLVYSVGEFQTDSGLHLLLWETSGVDDSGCGSGER